MSSLVPTAVIAEDDPVQRAALRRLLGLCWPELRIVAEAGNGIDALAALEREAPRIAFLDIDMPGLSGLEVAQQTQGRWHIVFVTAFDAHAVAAFEQGAIDYVLKPYDEARLALTLGRVRERLGARPPTLDQLISELARHRPAPDYLRWINASTGQELRVIDVDEVCYFQADTKYTRVVTADGEALIRRSLKELAEQLDPQRFWTIHRATIVNLNAIAGVSRDFRGHVSVRLKARREKLAVSETYQPLFRQM